MENETSTNTKRKPEFSLEQGNEILHSTRGSHDDGVSVHTFNSKPFSLQIEFVKKTSMVQVLKRRTLKKNEALIVIKAYYYQSSEMEEAYTWEMFKTVAHIREFLGNLKKVMKEEKDKKFIIKAIENLLSVKPSEMLARPEKLIESINKFLAYSFMKNQVVFHEFLEISRHSFHSFNEGKKPKEGYIMKKSDPNICRTIFSYVFCCCVKIWNKRWFVLKDDMIFYLDSSITSIGKDIFWFDQEIQVERDYNKTKNSICILNLSRKLILKFSDEFERELWYDLISQKIKSYQSNVKNIYNSFVNERFMCHAQWFVDGNSYFNDLYCRLLQAQETIFIAGWWVSPEIFLQRPVSVNDYTEKKNDTHPNHTNKQQTHSQREPDLNRLIDILKYKAEKGVQIYILIFKETTMALPIESQHTKTLLNNYHINIKVTRHPKNSFDLLWSHHEKIVIIDQKFGYVGGLDLCWGRYDTSAHQLSELKNEKKNYRWPGIDYSNARVLDFSNVQEYLTDRIDRGTVPRMPWHDVQILLEGSVVTDLSRHFVERWNFARAIDRIKTHTIVNVRTVKTAAISAINKVKKVFKSNNRSLYKSLTHARSNLDLSLQANLLDRTDAVNNNDNSYEDQMIQEMRPVEELRKTSTFSSQIRSSCELNGEREFQIDPTKRRSSIFTTKNNNVSRRPSILEKLKGAFRNMKKKSTIMTKTFYKKIFSNENSQNPETGDFLHMNISQRRNRSLQTMTCQVLRSASMWSVGLDRKDETSILNAYYDLIENARHYILIENQFFISKSYTEEEYAEKNTTTSNIVINEIALKIRQRIERAYKEKTKFRVFIFIPLLPGFPGEVGDSPTLQLILKYTYKTISRNHGLSLIEKLYSLMGEKYEDYIFFFSLRTHGYVNSTPKTELIYIHSKLMIIDDQICLLGSANINDRSMLGYRDSEIAVLVKDDEKIESLMNSELYLASNFARSLRITLFKEHLGYSMEINTIPEILIDPLDNCLFERMKSLARQNSKYYREIFNCYPDDNFTKFSDINFIQQREREKGETFQKIYEKNKMNIIGNIVEFPLSFLKEEKLQRGYFCREIFVPLKNFL